MYDQGQQPSDGWGAPRSRSGQPPEGQAPQYGQAPQFGQQPQQPQHPYMPYQPPQPPKKGKKGRIVLFSILGLFLLIVIAGIAGGNTSSGSAAVSTSTTVAAAPTTTPAKAVAQATTQAPATTQAAPAKKVVLTVEGNGINSTKSFTISSGDYSVAYTYDCSNFGTSGNFIADVQQSGNDLFDDPVANTMGDKGRDTTYLHDGPGTFYLSVNSECSWTVKVTDGDNG